MTRTKNGYLMIDHRASPGFTPDQAIKRGLQPGDAKEGSFYESDIWRCEHCGSMVVLNPVRTRQRAYCGKCNAYICDWCEHARQHPDYIHRSIDQQIDYALAYKGV